MKINYDSHPILKSLLTENLLLSSIEKNKFSDNEYLQMNTLWKKYKHDFTKEIHNISTPFFESLREIQDKLKYMTSNILEDDMCFSAKGTFIIADKVFMISFEQNDLHNRKICIFSFLHGESFLGMMEMDNHETRMFNVPKFCKIFGFEDTKENEAIIHAFILQVLLSIQLFKKFAKVETRVVSSESKIRTKNFERYVNGTKLPIVQLDCNWFTTTIKGEGFGVSSHFRLQPYNDENGQKTYKFIIIDAFKKTGYTRKAKKLDEPLSEKDLELENRLNIEENLKSE